MTVVHPKLIEQLNQAFENRTEITISEAKAIIESIVMREVEEEYIREYLKQKKCEIIEVSEENREFEMEDFADEPDLTIDEILDLPDPIQNEENEEYAQNVQMIGNYRKFRDQNLFEQLVKNNQRLVKRYAWAYVGFMGNKLSFEDLEAEGYIGLMQAINRFDPTRGNQFSTYAVYWIRQAIRRAIANIGYTVRIPVYTFELIFQIQRLEQRQMLQGMKVEIEQICQELGISYDQYLQAKQVEHQFLNIASLNAIVSEEDDDTELLEFITSERMKILEDQENEYSDPYWMVERKLERETLWNLVNQLKPRHRDILILRYGLLDDQTRTLEEVGKIFGLTRERIRQLESKALKELRRKLAKIKFQAS